MRRGSRGRGCPDALWASAGERSGEAKSEEIFDYLIHVPKEKGLRKSPWIHLPQTQEQKDDDKRMSPNTKLLTGLKDLMKSEFGGMATLLKGIPALTTGAGDVAGGKTTSGEETTKSPVRKKPKGGSPKKKKGSLETNISLKS